VSVNWSGTLLKGTNVNHLDTNSLLIFFLRV